MERKEEERLEQERLKSKLAAERANLCGWADTMTNMRFGRVMATLKTLVRVDGSIMPKYDFVKQAVSVGWKPESANVHTRKGNTKTEYRLKKDGIFYTINKTEYDFSRYLLNKMISQPPLAEN